jgi:hypothetical protein
MVAYYTCMTSTPKHQLIYIGAVQCGLLIIFTPRQQLIESRCLLTIGVLAISRCPLWRGIHVENLLALHLSQESQASNSLQGDVAFRGQGTQSSDNSQGVSSF